MDAPKNKVYTQGYFIKRLRDCGFYVCKIFEKYQESDPRYWTVLINPADEALFLTCYVNKNEIGQVIFELNDGGVRFPKNYQITTDSLEVIIFTLVERGITNKPTIYAREEKDV
jgi:hypothetical protein